MHVYSQYEKKVFLWMKRRKKKTVKQFVSGLQYEQK